jgi:hypothetical protein
MRLHRRGSFIAHSFAVVETAASASRRSISDDDYWKQPPPTSNGGERLTVEFATHLLSCRRDPAAAGSPSLLPAGEGAQAAQIQLQVVWHWSDRRLEGWDRIGPDGNVALPPKLWGPTLKIVDAKGHELPMEEVERQFTMVDPALGRLQRAREYRGVVGMDGEEIDILFDSACYSLTRDGAIEGLMPKKLAYRLHQFAGHDEGPEEFDAVASTLPAAQAGCHKLGQAPNGFVVYSLVEDTTPLPSPTIAVEHRRGRRRSLPGRRRRLSMTLPPSSSNRGGGPGGAAQGTASTVIAMLHDGVSVSLEEMLSPSGPNVLFSAPIMKRGGGGALGNKKWKAKFGVLLEQALVYFDSDEVSEANMAQRVVPLTSCRMVVLSQHEAEQEHAWQLTTAERQYQFAAPSQLHAHAWMGAISAQISRPTDTSAAGSVDQLQHRLDLALSPQMTDVATMRRLLAEASDSGLRHPVVAALQTKCDTAEGGTGVMGGSSTTTAVAVAAAAPAAGSVPLPSSRSRRDSIRRPRRASVLMAIDEDLSEFR